MEDAKGQTEERHIQRKKPTLVCDDPLGTPYGTNVSAPSIVKPDVDGFLSVRVGEAENAIRTRYEEIVAELDTLVEQSRDTELIYNASISFVPIVGHVYHLYERDNGSTFLSLIEPERWVEMREKCLGSFRLATDSLWVRV